VSPAFAEPPLGADAETPGDDLKELLAAFESACAEPPPSYEDIVLRRAFLWLTRRKA
jgi:hypothetical protein